MSLFPLAKELEEEYLAVRSAFRKIEDSWKAYADNIIPEDPELIRKIVNFVISVIDYSIENLDSIDKQAYKTFLANYDLEFAYGPSGDDNYYLSIDESVNGEGLSEFCWELKHDETPFTQEKLREIRSKYTQILTQL